MSRIRLKIESSKKELERKRKERKKHANDIVELERGIKDLTGKLEELREKGRDGGKKLHLDDNELQQYFRM